MRERPAPISLSLDGPSHVNAPARPTNSSASSDDPLRHLREKVEAFHRSTAVAGTEMDAFGTTCDRLRQAVSRGDVHQAWTLWSTLREHNQLPLLGRNQLDAYSRCIIRHASKSTCGRDDRLVWENLAFEHALAGVPDALEACILFYIFQQDYDSALRLYHRYHEQPQTYQLNNTPTQEDEDGPVQDGDDVSESDPKAQYDYPRLPVGEIRLLLTAVICHAAKDDIHSALRLYLPLSPRFPHYTVEDFVEKVKNSDSALAAKIQPFVRKLAVAGLLSRPRNFVNYLQSIAMLSRPSLTTNLYRLILDGMECLKPWIAPKPSAADPMRVVTLHDTGWATFLTAFIVVRDIDGARQVFSDMGRLGVPHSVTAWNGLLEGFARTGEVDHAISTWEGMQKQGLLPNATSYRQMLSAMYKGKQPSHAAVYSRDFDAYVKKNQTADGQVDGMPAIIVYNVALNGLLDCKEENAALAMLERLRQKGPTPDITTYNTFLAHYGRWGDLQSLAKILQQLKDAKLSGDVFTFSTVLSALIKAGRDDAPTMVMTLMKRSGVELNVAIHTSILDAMLREHDPKHLKAAMDFLLQMEHSPSPDMHPNAVTYVAVLTGIHRKPWADRRLAAECKELVLKGMRARNIRLNAASYHILIKACLDNREPEGIEHAVRYYRDLLKRRLPLDKNTAFLLLKGLRDRGEYGLANVMADEMMSYGLVPAGALQLLVGQVKMAARRSNARI